MSQAGITSLAAAGVVIGPTPASSTDHAVVRWDGTSGRLVEDSVVIIDDTGNVTGVVAFTASGLVTMSAGVVHNKTTPGAYPYAVLRTDYTVLVDTSVARTINLPNAPTSGQVFVIKDATGTAGANNISVTTPGGVVTIDGVATYTMNVNRGALMVQFDGTNYQVI